MKVVIIGKFSHGTERLIRNIFPREWEIVILPSEKLQGEIGDAEVIIPEHVLIDGAFLDRAKNLKLVQTGAGFDNVVIEECTKRGIYAANAAGVNATAVAEHVMAYILCWYKNMILLDGAVKRGNYDVDYIGSELSGKIFGIVGLGNVGKKVAHFANCFGMKILGYAVRPVKTGHEIEFTDFMTLLKSSEVISLHLPLNSQTRHLIGQGELELMKRDALLINTSRGPIIDENALIGALLSRTIGGAALDVYEKEPLPEDSQLRKLDNVILTPHTAGMPNGLKFHRQRYEFFVENIRRVAEGKPPTSALNKL
jgi:D-3-phosphoglycerate dehydrogenase